MTNNEAIKRIKDHIKVHKIGEYPHLLIGDALELAIEALEQQEWISVEDGLPINRHYPPVICRHDKDNWTDAAIVTGRGNWINSEGCEIYPTHWRPLPEPPKEESDNE